MVNKKEVCLGPRIESEEFLGYDAELQEVTEDLGVRGIFEVDITFRGWVFMSNTKETYWELVVAPDNETDKARKNREKRLEELKEEYINSTKRRGVLEK